MIDIKDLKIGNVINLIGWDEVHTVLGITKNMLFVRGRNGCHWAFYEQFEGIPIWREGLIKAGFKEMSKSNGVLELVIKDHGEYQTSLQACESFIEICRSGINAISVPVIYLHQLQNLIWTLVGKELDINSYL